VSYTLATLESLRDSAISGIVLESVAATPFVKHCPAPPVPGSIVNVPVVTEDPAPEFRNENQGKADALPNLITKPVELSYADASWRMDDMTATGNFAGGVSGATAFAASAAMRGCMANLEKNCFSGTDGKFLGLDQWCNAANTIDAGGSGNTSTIYLVNWNSVKLYVGNDGVFEVGDIERGETTDQYGKAYWVWRQLCRFRCGLAAVNSKGFARIVNVGTTKDTRASDEWIFRALAKFGVATPCEAIFMSRTSARDLRIGRTGYSLTGAPSAPIVDVNGIPVHVSEVIPDAV
jgi:hypothetical protein